jgi:hypothetical protein
MTNSIQSIIAEREITEALTSRYAKTIKRYRWTSLENIRLSISEFIGKYISECDKEDTGVYRNHKFHLTAHQEHWLKYLMEKEYKYMITIKLPHYEIDGFKRTKKQAEAVEQLRKLIREIEQEYTGHKHWERDCFDFRVAIEHGISGFHHCHLVVVANTMNYETTYNKLQESIKRVLQKHKLFKTCIELTYVYDQIGLCMYLVKELEDAKSDDNLRKEYSYLADLYGLFHIKVKNRHVKLDNPLGKIIKLISTAFNAQEEKSLVKANPINKLPVDTLKLSTSSFKQARTKRKRKRL